MSCPVICPADGQLVKLSTVNDPVFARNLMGAGVAIVPTLDDVPTGDGAPCVDVPSPISGTIIKVLPHAFIVKATPDGTRPRAVLVHLGINTVSLPDELFDVCVTQGQVVTQSETVLRWNPGQLRHHYDADITVIVVAVEQPDVDVCPNYGDMVTCGMTLFTL